MKITFECHMIDKQIDMVNAAITEHPYGLSCDAPDSKAEASLLPKAHDRHSDRRVRLLRPKCGIPRRLLFLRIPLKT